MRKMRTFLVFFFLSLFLMVSSLILGQRRRQRLPWDERSPSVGNKVPDLMVYDKDLHKIPFSNLYKDTILVIQWGGCT